MGTVIIAGLVGGVAGAVIYYYMKKRDRDRSIESINNDRYYINTNYRNQFEDMNLRNRRVHIIQEY